MILIRVSYIVISFNFEFLVSIQLSLKCFRATWLISVYLFIWLTMFSFGLVFVEDALI